MADRVLVRVVALLALGLALMTGAHSGAAERAGAAEPFIVSIPEAVLVDLQARIARTRWPDRIAGSEWDYGTDTVYLQELLDYWAKEFDWRAQERKLNAFRHFRAEVDGIGIHFIHEKGKGPDPIPVLLLHGWPSSFLQFLDIIPLLTDPAAHGAPDAPSFDVVVASLPGYGFSDIPAVRGFAIREMAERMTRLMVEVLGYERFAVRGSDIGGSVLHQMALAHPDRLIGVHVSGALRGVPVPPEEELTEAERQFYRDMEAWNAEEIAYARLHASKPQTLAHALNDSPAGLASWIVEKFRTWADTGGDVERRFTKDELLANITLYWATQTIAPSIRLYYEFAREQRLTGRVEVPTAVLIAAHDMVPPPREFSERLYNVVRWNRSAVGGHFLEWEEPALVAADMRDFFSEIAHIGKIR